MFCFRNQQLKPKTTVLSNVVSEMLTTYCPVKPVGTCLTAGLPAMVYAVPGFVCLWDEAGKSAASSFGLCTPEHQHHFTPGQPSEQDNSF